MRLISKLFLTAAALGGLGGSARAEVLQVFWLAPAGNDRLAELRTLAIEEFGGNEGPALAIRIEDMLRGVSLDGSEYFRVLASRGADPADGVLRGTAESDVRFARFTEEREECAARDAAEKCTEQKEIKVKCARRIIDLTVALRVVRIDGTVIHTEDRPETQESKSCEGDPQPPRARADVVRDMIRQVADRLRLEAAPRHRDEAVRVDENRKGLAKPDAARFKAAVRLTKTDTRAACGAWREVAASNPQHLPTMFNLALCNEHEGQRDAAVQGYRAVLGIAPRTYAASAAISRIALDAQARAQIAAHNGG